MYAEAAGVNRSRQRGQQTWVIKDPFQIEGVEELPLGSDSGCAVCEPVAIRVGSCPGGRVRTPGRRGSSRGSLTARH